MFYNIIQKHFVTLQRYNNKAQESYIVQLSMRIMLENVKQNLTAYVKQAAEYYVKFPFYNSHI